MALLDTWRESTKPEGVKAIMSWNGVIINDASIDVLGMLFAYMKKAAGESCGQCFPCRSGLKKIVAILKRRCQNEGKSDDIERLQALALLVYESARCDIGQTAPLPLLDILANAEGALDPRVVRFVKYAELVTSPCMSACPSNVDVPGYLEKIRNRDFHGAFRCIMADCPMPRTVGRVCVRPCEKACKRGNVDAPLAIKYLKRFVADNEALSTKTQYPPKQLTSLPRVAVIGAGPAGLSCAYYLASQGSNVTIFEQHEAPGGMARFGIPGYRLPESILFDEVEKLLSMGCEIKYGVTVGKDIFLNDLRQQGFAAFFIGVGATEAALAECAGSRECFSGYIPGIDYLAGAARHTFLGVGKKVAIIGGGNVAMDCARVAIRQGFTEVHVVYRREESDMPADVLEVLEAKEEGVHFHFLAAPAKVVLSEEGNIKGLICQKMSPGELDASGRSKPLPIAGSEFTLSCETVIPAIGQKVSFQGIFEGDFVLSDGEKKVSIDKITGKVAGVEGVFAGGDCATGPDSLIAAIAAGKRSASHIAAYIQGCEPRASSQEQLIHMMAKMGEGKEEPTLFKGYTKALSLRTEPLEKRISSFCEVEFGTTEKEAVVEASRCLRCYRVVIAAL